MAIILRGFHSSFPLFPRRQIVHGEEFLSVGQGQLIDLISSDDLDCEREEDVLEAVMRWLGNAREGRMTNENNTV